VQKVKLNHKFECRLIIYFIPCKCYFGVVNDSDTFTVCFAIELALILWWHGRVLAKSNKGHVWVKSGSCIGISKIVCPGNTQ